MNRNEALDVLRDRYDERSPLASPHLRELVLRENVRVVDELLAAGLVIAWPRSTVLRRALAGITRAAKARTRKGNR